MSPLPDELRTALQSRAESISAPPDPFDAVEARARQLRHRRAGGYAATAAVAAVLAIVIGIAIAAGNNDTSRVQVGNDTPTPSQTPSIPPGETPINILSWTPRGDAADDTPTGTKTEVLATMNDAVNAWIPDHEEHGGAAYTATHLLWSGVLPDGRRAVVFQAWWLKSVMQPPDAWTVFYAEKPGEDPTAPAADATLLSTPTYFHDLTPGAPQSAEKYEVTRIPELSAFITSATGPSVVLVLGKHAADTVEYGPDPTHMTSEEAFQGVAMFGPSVPTDPSKAIIEVRDSAGELTYRGPIDVGATTTTP